MLTVFSTSSVKMWRECRCRRGLGIGWNVWLEHRLWVRESPRTICETLGKSLNQFVPQSLICKMGMMMTIPASLGSCED